ncbi:MAG TPA: hypothetical protein DCM17_06755, partial [Dehalococcoidia bacterium]|nr:hypothetical protein [Dehalococcoidia bacterium]
LFTVVLLALSLLACTAEATPRPNTVAAPAKPRVDSPTKAPLSPVPNLANATRPPRSTASILSSSDEPTRPPQINTVGRSNPDYLTAAPDRDLYQLAAELIPGVSPGFPRVVTPTPPEFETGRIDTFWLLDLPTLKMYQSDFELRLITPHAYWYVQEGRSIKQNDLEASASAFEGDIYPRVTKVLGTEWSPGVDNDPHLNILNARLEAIGGYFTSGDEYPKTVFPFSNQREIIYLDTSVSSVGSPGYNRTLAHELQHAIHWNEDPSDETWINEGLSELAVTVAGYGQNLVGRFLGGPPTSLVNWPLSLQGAGAHYGASSLFMHYLYEHYATPTGLRPLLADPKDGIEGIDSYLAASDFEVTFRDIFGDWVVANLLDEDEGKYAHPSLDARTRVRNIVDYYSDFDSEIPQYAVEYIELQSLPGPMRLSFQGKTETPLLPVDPGTNGCWWSNSGDSINSTLTRALDLRELSSATLKYELWYSLEELWDYAYLEVSTDGGQTWSILDAPHTSEENPVGNSYGKGYTGESGGWIQESVNLDAYAGQEVLLRFQYITDDVVNGAGLCLRHIAISGGPLTLTDGWEANGFILINNHVPQDYIVQVVEVARSNQVRVMPLDAANSGEIVVDAPQDLDRLIVAVAALAPKTLQPAAYTITVAPVE